jgi:hypothetical protein
MPKAKPAKQVAPILFRLAPELVARIERHARRMEKATPGVTFTRTDAVRALLTAALDAAEREDG